MPCVFFAFLQGERPDPIDPGDGVHSVSRNDVIAPDGDAFACAFDGCELFVIPEPDGIFPVAPVFIHVFVAVDGFPGGWVDIGFGAVVDFGEKADEGFGRGRGNDGDIGRAVAEFLDVSDADAGIGNGGLCGDVPDVKSEGFAQKGECAAVFMPDG